MYERFITERFKRRGLNFKYCYLESQFWQALCNHTLVADYIDLCPWTATWHYFEILKYAEELRPSTVEIRDRMVALQVKLESDPRYVHG